MSNGVKLGFDTCLSVNDRRVANTLKIIGDNHIVFTSGAAIVVKDFLLNTQVVVSRKGSLRNVSAVDGWMMAEGKENRGKHVGLVIGESSTTENNSIGIHICAAGLESSWVTLTTTGVAGDVKKLHVRPEKKQLVALVQSQNDTKQQRVYLWNFNKDKLVASQALTLTLEDISFHPALNNKVGAAQQFLFFGNSHLRLWELNSKTKVFIEGKPLVNPRIENEGTFVDFQWMLKKTQVHLLVLSSNNVVRYFQEDLTKEPIEVRIEFASMSIKVISTARQVAKDIDDTFGFGGLGANDKSEKDILGQDEAREPNFDMFSKERVNREAKVPRDVTCSAICATPDGFVIAATGGIVCYYRAPDAARIREHRKSVFYNTQSFQVFGIKDERIEFLSTDTKFKIVSLVLASEVRRAHPERSRALPAHRPGQRRGRGAPREILPRGLPQLPHLRHELLSQPQPLRHLGPGRSHPALGLRQARRPKRRQARHPRGPAPREPRLGGAAPLGLLPGSGLQQRLQSVHAAARKLFLAEGDQPDPVHAGALLAQRPVPPRQ